ncbi:hypothetical protein PV327_003362 [Microctonus hyperodae]|uniref:Uncharacterized protein n=1 Tax=Microctonus hyperodae TaxID=165561 RepID=A0AA39G4C3_MICHY|nr:hypothetical protein PV327_003362 [Microctonus hyperodae]
MTDLLIGIAGSGFQTSENSATTSSSTTVTSNNGDVVYRTRNPSSIYRNSEMRHSRSEDILGGVGVGTPTRTQSPLLLDQGCASEDDLVATTALRDASSSSSLLQHSIYSYGGRRNATSPPPTFNATDRIDPEDSIRDIVTENDLYKFVLFKRHYDKYVALAEKYEESRGISYYLEERYHEVKAEKDRLIETQQELERRLESCEALLRDKEEELFLHLERSLRLDDEIDRLKNEYDACNAERERLEREQTSALRQLQLQATQSELTRRNLEHARQDIVRQTTVIRAERDALEHENTVLKEKLRLEQIELGTERRRREEGIAVLSHEAVSLRYAARHLHAAALHAVTCKRRRRCSVCLYAKRAFNETDEYRDDGKLFKCLKTPLQDLRTWLHPIPFQPTSSSSSSTRTRSPTVRGVSYIDESSSSSEDDDDDDDDDADDDHVNNDEDDDDEFGETIIAEISLSSTNSGPPPPASRAFSSDSGFSSEIGDRRSRSYEVGGSSRKISASSASSVIDPPGSTAANSDDVGQRFTPTSFIRSKWTSSFRRFLGRKSKTKINLDQVS